MVLTSKSNYKKKKNDRKKLQNPEGVHVVKLSEVCDPLLCPTQTLKSLIEKRVLSPSDPLLVCDDFSVLTQLNIRTMLCLP